MNPPSSNKQQSFSTSTVSGSGTGTTGIPSTGLSIGIEGGSSSSNLESTPSSNSTNNSNAIVNSSGFFARPDRHLPPLSQHRASASSPIPSIGQASSASGVPSQQQQSTTPLQQQITSTSIVADTVRATPSPLPTAPSNMPPTIHDIDKGIHHDNRGSQYQQIQPPQPIANSMNHPSSVPQGHVPPLSIATMKNNSTTGWGDPSSGGSGGSNYAGAGPGPFKPTQHTQSQSSHNEQRQSLRDSSFPQQKVAGAGTGVAAIVDPIKPGEINVEENPWQVQFPYPPSAFKKGSNYIRTTKYTLLTFIPLNLYSQFQRFYNFYFLLGALSVLLGQSSLNEVSQIFPLALVLSFTAIKDAVEDFSRYLSDQEANNYSSRVLRDGKKIDVLAMDIQPGDLIYVVKGEKFPVDAVLISTSYDDGTCFIETAELDGETNLKRRSALAPLTSFTKMEDVSRINGLIQCERPNENLTSFEGRLNYTIDSPTAQKTVLPLTMNNLLLRGAVLRNTDFCWGAVVYTGNNTKIIKNLKRAGLKSSRLEAKLNLMVIAAFGFNIILLMGSTVLEYMHYKLVQQEEQQNLITQPSEYIVEWYLGAATDVLSQHFINTFLGYFALYTYIIPISLFVTIEVVRLVQARFMMWDIKMTLVRTPKNYNPNDPDQEPENVPMRANNSNLNEDLGVIEYIFSDKTGTLTQNEMRMAMWFVDGLVLDEMKNPGELGKRMRDPATSPRAKEVMNLFARAIAVCHTVIPAIDEKTLEMIYESQSPDESALLNGLAANDVKLTFRTKSHVTIEVFGEEQRFEVLQLLDFTSDRKRMSVIVETPEGKHLYCKGADNIILSRLSPKPDLNPPELVTKAETAVQEFSESGLRTLLVAYVPLTDEAYETFREEYETAERSLNQRERRMSAACDKIESNLRLLGCTAIEDRLQDQVPETIEYLMKCDIRIWLLTGDKQETAINIGMSSRLISTDMAVMILNGETEDQVGDMLDAMVEEIDNRTDGRPNALVVNGDTLGYILSSGLESKLLHIGVRCHSVICCRVTPLQKALVVKLVRGTLGKVTLAIGDGANDVSMIQAADVGVGIMGREGTQAVRSSDYAFAEFRYLRRLLSVHGRYSTVRLSTLIFYSFYKNFTCIIVQWWFGFYNLWSGQIVYEGEFLTLFNVVLTSIPPLFLAIFEMDVEDYQIDEHPELYRQVRAAIFFVVWFAEQDEAVEPQGRVIGYWVQCFFFGTPMLLTVLLKCVLITMKWVWPSWVSIVASMAATLVVQSVVEYAHNESWFDVAWGTLVDQHSLPIYYLLLILVPVVALLPDVCLMYLRHHYFPADPDIMVEDTVLSKSRKRDKLRLSANVVAPERKIPLTTDCKYEEP
ncbi:hypothetical protein HDU76_000813 [Blyttiomyces sp. JEL0837]|nr:hypothetical protein HDU76_000813 [Blyttiomyces sp. JEL0837]